MWLAIDVDSRPSLEKIFTAKLCYRGFKNRNAVQMLKFLESNYANVVDSFYKRRFSVPGHLCSKPMSEAAIVLF